MKNTFCANKYTKSAFNCVKKQYISTRLNADILLKKTTQKTNTVGHTLVIQRNSTLTKTDNKTLKANNIT